MMNSSTNIFMTNCCVPHMYQKVPPAPLAKHNSIVNSHSVFLFMASRAKQKDGFKETRAKTASLSIVGLSTTLSTVWKNTRNEIFNKVQTGVCRCVSACHDVWERLRESPSCRPRYISCKEVILPPYI